MITVISMRSFLEKIHIQSKAVLYAAYWTCLATLFGAMALLLAGFTKTGSQMIYTALNIIILAAFICLGIELNELMKGQQ